MTQLQQFQKERPHLIWDTKPTLSDEKTVERTLQYGSWQDVQDLISLLGKNQVAAHFITLKKKTRTNLSPQFTHFFSLYLT